MDSSLFDIEERSIWRRWSEDSWYAPRLGLVNVDSDRSRALDHEASHFVAHFSTPYGVMTRCIDALADRLVINYCEGRVESGDDLPILTPIYLFARAVTQRSTRCTKRTEDAVRNYIVPWSQLSRLTSIFEGGRSKTSTAASALDGLASLSDFESLWHRRAGVSTPVEAPTFELNAVVTACPLAHLEDGMPVGIGAHHILELIATLIESDSIALLPGNVQTDHSFFLDYWYLWSYYLASLIKNSSFQPARITDYKNTALVIAQLALYGPCGPHFAQMRPPGLTWRDLHPGWRFVRAIEAAKGLGFVRDISSQGLDYSDALCRAMGWPTMSDMLAFGAAVQGENDTAHAVRLAFSHQQIVQSPQPNFSEAEASFNRLLERFGPVVWIRDERKFKSMRNDLALEEFVGHLYVSEWCSCVMYHGPPTHDFVLAAGVDPSLIYDDDEIDAARLFSTLIANNPWMSPTHYVPL